MDELSPFMALQKSKGCADEIYRRFSSCENRKPGKFIFFMSIKDPHDWASNFHQEKNDYCLKGLRLLTSKHDLLYLNAKVFQDERMMAHILEEQPQEKPRNVVARFRHTMKLPKRFINTVLYEVLINKFLSSPRLAKLLLSTGNSFIIKAGL